RIRDYGGCRTVRFDDAPENVDLAGSSNVQGYCHEGSALYVHLGKGAEATIRLGGDGSGAYLIDANGEWEAGEIRALTGAEATFMTPAGPVRRSSRSHDLKADL